MSKPVAHPHRATLRAAILRAMGVDVWRERSSPATVQSPSAAPEPIKVSQPDPVSRPTQAPGGETPVQLDLLGHLADRTLLVSTRSAGLASALADVSRALGHAAKRVTPLEAFVWPPNGVALRSTGGEAGARSAAAAWLRRRIEESQAVIAVVADDHLYTWFAADQGESDTNATDPKVIYLRATDLSSGDGKLSVWRRLQREIPH